MAETYANLPYESFAHLGELVANCGFMLDISHVRSIGLREIFIVADGEILPGGAINCPPRASEQEVYIEQSGIAHVSIYRTGSYDVLSERPMHAAILYSKSRKLGKDARRLGVLIGDVEVNGALIDIEDYLVFSSGFHNAERGSEIDVRWTDGAGKLAFSQEMRALSVRFKALVLSCSVT